MKGFYSGFGPILFKQIPYTMAKFAVQGSAQDVICGATGIDAETMTGGTKMAVALSSGTIAGVAAAIISHPADIMHVPKQILSKSGVIKGSNPKTIAVFKSFR